jgi:signal transduction histidine kinase
VSTDLRGDPELLVAPGELQQILVNIINNAADATRPNGILRIRVRHAPDWKKRTQKGIRITIADSGSGMSVETLQRIREPFFTTKEGEGTGLGMWVVQELVSKYKGKLSIRTSTKGNNHGSIFSVFLPSSTVAG